MANTRNMRETSESRGQVANKLLQEAKRIEARIMIMEDTVTINIKQVIQVASCELQEYIFEKFSMGIKEWNHIKEELSIDLAKGLEEERIREERIKAMDEMMVVMKDTLREEVKREMVRSRATVGTKYTYNRIRDQHNKECFVCGKPGHMARYCSSRKVGVNNGSKDKENKEINFSSEFCLVNYEKNRKRSKKGLQIGEIVEMYPMIFKNGKEKIEFKTGSKCYIRTEKGKRIVRKGQCIPQSLRSKTKEYFEDLLARGIIRKSISDWRNPIRAIEKPNGDVRVVSNLIGLNDLVEKDPYELATIRDVIRSTQGSNLFTVIDLKEGFYHIEIEEKHKYKTAFEFDGNVYEWNSMVMGFKNSPQIMQKTMNKILEGIRGNGVEVYMDDIVIHGNSSDKHDKLLIDVLERFKENGLRINERKIQFKKEEVELLGVTVNGWEMKPSEIKKNEALEYKTPENIRDLRRFLGLAGWFGNFIKNFAMMTEELTNSLKSNRKWVWTDNMDDEFKSIKEALRNMSELKIPDYTKEFRLRTDASDTGIGAILLQTNREGKWVPIQWASKKLTPAERRYTISEKEMLAVFWGVKKFEYELKGRRFEIMTDHKALEEIRSKPCFNNNRINRWIEKIQEFDFRIEYVKGENMTDVDALSRQYQEDKTEEEIRKEVNIENQKLGKERKHKILDNNIEYWEFSSGKRAEIPKSEDRDLLIIQTHEKLNHRGMKGTYYELKKNFYWPGMKDQLQKRLKECEICQIGNRKAKGGAVMVATSRKGEKFAIDIMKIGELGEYILVGIDYFTRVLYGRVLKERTSREIISGLEEWFRNENVPEMIISDNAKEFDSIEFKKWCSDNEIDHRKVSVESHGSNGRIERAIRTIREGVFKLEDRNIGNCIEKVIEIYNNTYHSGIRCTPREAVEEENTREETRWMNSEQGEYAKTFKKRAREKFDTGQEVMVAKRENLGNTLKSDSGRFLRQGIILEKCEGDSYILRLDDGKIIKKRHYDLKRKKK